MPNDQLKFYSKFTENQKASENMFGHDNIKLDSFW